MKTIDNPFYIFGSEDSQDYDILVSVDNIPENIDAAHNICKFFNEEIGKILPNKKINCNLAIFQEDKIVKVFKGTIDELNNVLFYTYKHHEQFYTNPIKSVVERDFDEKILRVARFILTFFSRTDLRTEIKSALRGDLREKLIVLKKIDFKKYNEFPGKKDSKENIYKVLGFQFGQILSLMNGLESESYTKNEILKNYPSLSNLIKRKDISIDDLRLLDGCLHSLIYLIESKIEEMPLKEKK